MKFFIKPLAASCAALMLSSVAAVPAAHADELTALAGVASSYYWRGLQVSNGAQVWGELTYTHDTGFYGDLWASSEGFGVGPEYDLSAGWAGKFGDLGVNVGAVTYVYSKDNSQGGELDDNDPGDFSDVYLKLSYGPAFLSAYHNVALLQGQDWIYGGFTWEKFTFALGWQKFDDDTHLAASGYLLNSDGDLVNDKAEYTYLELTYAATKNLSFIVSGIVDDKDQEFFGSPAVPARADTNRTKVVVSYSLPIEM